MRGRILAGVVAGLLLVQPARADLPVIDAASLAKWVAQAQQMAQQLTQLENTVRSLTDVPQNLVNQVEGLLQQAVQNPLGNITQNLQVLMTGQGTGTCGNANTYLAQNQYNAATGGDFTGQWLNQSANRSAGLQACTQQMMAGTQTALTQLPALLTQLQGATDVTQIAAIAGRIQQAIATINAQQQQALLMGQTAMLQRMMQEDQLLQKQRADAQERINATSATAAGAAAPAAVPAPQIFQAGGL
jgi:hypothetical protein